MAIVSKWFGFDQGEVYEAALRDFELGRFEEAAEAFRTCLEDGVDPKLRRLARYYLAESWSSAGQAYLRERNGEAAAASFGEAISLCPRYADLHLGLARACRLIGNAGRAANALTTALEINPRYVEAALLEGILLYEAGRDEEALVRWAEALDWDRAPGGEALQTALDCHRRGARQAAVEAIEKLQWPGESEATLRGRVAAGYIRDGDFELAAAEYERAVRLAPGYADLRCKYGQVLSSLGRAPEAVEQLLAALAINERYVEAMVHLGLALRRLGQELEA
ncbi:MAG: tetratricopeptide repeat protein, partial [Fimbriimonas ginsengisoli]|nr:tetratricopeptide repeat protein [Fimbriimonas ginsengisoli]